MNSKASYWGVSSRALIISFLIYVLYFVAYSVIELQHEKAQLAVATEGIQKHKQRLVYISLFLNTIHHIDEQTLDRIYFERDKYGYEIHSYPLDANQSRDLSHDEDIIVSSIIYALGSINSSIADEHSLFAYRSYEGKGKIITFNKEIDGSKLTTEGFSKDVCTEYNLCTKYATKESLSDRLLVSKIYKDAVTGQDTLTLSSPVVWDGKIEGEVSVNLYVDNTTFASGSAVESISDGGINYTVIHFPRYPLSDASFRSTHVVDNKSIVLYEFPVTKLVADTFPMYLLLLCGIWMFLFHYTRIKIERKTINKLVEESTRDELTGLYNRKVFDSQSFIMDTHGQTLAILAIDGNKLKKINDTYGHHAGDAAIKHIATVMKRVFRNSDYLVRSGGDEFIAILPNCTPLRVVELKDALKDKLGGQKLKPYDVSVSISVGIAFKQPDEDIEHAIITADDNLYLDKKSAVDVSNRI